MCFLFLSKIELPILVISILTEPHFPMGHFGSKTNRRNIESNCFRWNTMYIPQTSVINAHQNRLAWAWLKIKIVLNLNNMDWDRFDLILLLYYLSKFNAFYSINIYYYYYIHMKRPSDQSTGGIWSKCLHYSWLFWLFNNKESGSFTLHTLYQYR